MCMWDMRPWKFIPIVQCQKTLYGHMCTQVCMCVKLQWRDSFSFGLQEGSFQHAHQLNTSDDLVDAQMYRICDIEFQNSGTKPQWPLCNFTRWAIVGFTHSRSVGHQFPCPLWHISGVFGVVRKWTQCTYRLSSTTQHALVSVSRLTWMLTQHDATPGGNQFISLTCSHKQMCNTFTCRLACIPIDGLVTPDCIFGLAPTLNIPTYGACTLVASCILVTGILLHNPFTVCTSI